MLTAMNRQILTLSALATAAVCLTPTLSAAEEITLVSADGSVRFSGEFIDFQNDAYVMDINGTELNIPAAFFLCEGDACVETIATVQDGPSS